MVYEMREIKFRAWDGNKMCEDITIEFLKQGFKTLNCFFNSCRESGIQVMQFTGLKDKNGKDIYEGDIVKFSTSTERARVFELMTVIYEKGCFEVERVESKEKLYLYVREVEVIGNIYENEEILELGE